MSSSATIRAAIVAMLKSVPGIGVVHDYQRYGKTDRDFRLLYGPSDRLLGWNVSRRALWQSQPFVGRWAITTQWEIRGFMSLNDEQSSEKTFDALTDLAQAAFRAAPTLGGVVSSIVLGEGSDDPAGLQIDESGPVMFCGVLCHGARCSLFTRHYLQEI